MKKTLLIILFSTLLLPIFNFAFAAPFPNNVQNDVYGVAQGGAINGIPTARDNNDGTPDINDAINLLRGTSFARNFGVDPQFLPNDEIWVELGSGQVVLIGLTAGNANTIGIYTDLGTGSVRTPVLGPESGFGFSGDGTIGNPFPAGVTGLLQGQNFGWYLKSQSNVVNYFFSEPTLNVDSQIDHLMTYDLSMLSGQQIYVDFGSGPIPIVLGSDTFLLAWEDLVFNQNTGMAGDDDYDDMMYLVTSVAGPKPYCSDGSVNQQSEQCDDGNLINGDGCNAVCQIEEPPTQTPVGGQLIPIDSAALLLAGVQSSFTWILPFMIAATGSLVFVLRR